MNPTIVESRVSSEHTTRLKDVLVEWDNSSWALYVNCVTASDIDEESTVSPHQSEGTVTMSHPNAVFVLADRKLRYQPKSQPLTVHVHSHKDFGAGRVRFCCTRCTSTDHTSCLDRIVLWFISPIVSTFESINMRDRIKRVRNVPVTITVVEIVDKLYVATDS